MKTKLDKKVRKGGLTLTLFYAFISFIGLVVDIFICVVIISILVNAGAISISNEYVPDIQGLIFLMAGMSLVLGWIFTFITNIIVINPINKVITAMHGLASGNFQTRLKFTKIARKIPDIANVEDSFNTLAEELSNTEILRADFINSFSHEFKTPIVSILGFAKLLRHAELSEEEREQYLVAIEEESTRLSSMSANVLSLTKVENQTILNDKTEFNLSEQIRNSFLLLEPKWQSREIDFELDFEEYFITAGEELLKEVWINLIDNAIKFTPDGGNIRVEICEEDRNITVKVSNIGEQIPAEKLKKIFGKFYQCDESHSEKGNGIGLAIVKRVAELHGGSVKAESCDGINIFSVKLPRG